MRLSRDAFRRFCRNRGLSVSEALWRAGVSRNAFYTLTRKTTVLPRSVTAIARALNVPPSALLDETPDTVVAAELIAHVDRIMTDHAGLERDTVRHTLLLLRKPPIERLRGALRRGRTTHLQR